MTDQWAQIRSCSHLHEAGFIKSLLESEGIDVQIPDEYALGVNPGYTNAFGGVRLLVRVDQLERAEELLAST